MMMMISKVKAIIVCTLKLGLYLIYEWRWTEKWIEIIEMEGEHVSIVPTVYILHSLWSPHVAYC